MEKLKDLNLNYKKFSPVIVQQSEALKNAVINFINLNTGEMPFEINKGSKIEDYIYAPDTDNTELDSLIQDSIQDEFSFLDITVETQLVNNTRDSIAINISYTDPYTLEKQNIELETIK